MQKDNKNEVHYHLWNSDEDLMAKVNTSVQLPNGGNLHTCIGELAIKKGDAIYFDYGRSMGVNTMSGKGYESEFKFGRVILHGCPLSLVLDQEQSQHVKATTSSKEEFDAKVLSQKERINSEIGAIKDIFIFNEMQHRLNSNRIRAQAEAKTKERIKQTISQMDQVFNSPKPKKM